MCLLSLSSWFLTIAWIKFRVLAGKLVQQKNGYDNRVWFEVSRQTKNDLTDEGNFGLSSPPLNLGSKYAWSVIQKHSSGRSE